jgi:CpXC protein
MAQSMATQITCPNCRQPFSAVLEQIIDAGRDPQAKARLLAGRTNLVTCPNCGYQSMLSTPMVYHDPNKQLLILYIPMELGLPQKEQERLVGSLTNAVMSSLPAEQRKGYLFTPKTALSMQGLVETILEADGVTKEMLEEQRQKMRLVETFLQVDPEQLPELVQQHDDKLDAEFFSMLAATAETAIASGRRDVAEHVLGLRDRLLELSSTGQELLQKAADQESRIQEVANALNALGENATQEDFVNLTLQLADIGDDETLQVLVGLARPVMDYQFFRILSERIEQAEGEEKERLLAIRDRLLDLTGAVDKQNEAVLKQAADTLRAIANSSDIEAAIRSRLELLDDTFLAVLSANIQNAEQNKDLMTAARLKTIFEKVVAILQESAPPVIKFINELMQYQDADEARQKLTERAHEFGPELVQWMDMLREDLAARGNNMALERLGQLRDEAVQVLESAGPQYSDNGHAYEEAEEHHEQEQTRPEQSPIILPFSSRKRSRKQ